MPTSVELRFQILHGAFYSRAQASNIRKLDGKAHNLLAHGNHNSLATMDNSNLLPISIYAILLSLVWSLLMASCDQAMALTFA